MNDSFFPCMSPLPCPEEMREWDRAAMEAGLPEPLLMENAARSAFLLLKNKVRDLGHKKIILFMGSGNNGGDAASLSRSLANTGAKCCVFHSRPINQYASAPAMHINAAMANGVKFIHIPEDSIENENRLLQKVLKYMEGIPDIIIDGLLGTGFIGPLKPGMQMLIEAINKFSDIFSGMTVALDIPSGLDAITGKPAPVAVRAHLTISFAAAKPGLVMSSSKRWVGELYVCDIGMPTKISKHLPSGFFLLDGSTLSGLPEMPADTYKNIFGHVMIIGGARGLSGAAHLAAMGALRAGAGLVTAIAPSGSAEQIKSGCPEIMIHKLGNAGAELWPEKLEPETINLLMKANSLVIGPGMGRGRDADCFLRTLLDLPERPPAIFDADALVMMGRDKKQWEKVSGRDIITPHPGEASALLGWDSAEIQKNRLGAIRALCEITDAAVVLKGADSLVSQSGYPVLLCPFDIPQLAIGGAGDVLAGCLGALRAQGKVLKHMTLHMAGIGVILHALAGMLCASEFPARGVLASSLANAIPEARKKFSIGRPHEPYGTKLPWPQCWTPQI